MNTAFKRILIAAGIFSTLGIFPLAQDAKAQTAVSVLSEYTLLKHGHEQYQQGHYNLAIQSIKEFLKQDILPTGPNNTNNFSLAVQQAKYLLVLAQLKAGVAHAEEEMAAYIKEAVNPVYRQRAAFALAQYYFRENDLPSAITYYEIAGIDNLSNDEIADAKFELAYSYFNNRAFEQAKPLFAVIKELPENKYYIAGNYYYGLLAYNDKNYEQALKSFERVHNEPEYKDIVPYYEAEIHYFTGNYDKVLQISNRYLKKKEPLFYHKEMQLLTGQTYFEQKKFKEALPYFEYYYEHSDRIRKEELYELAFTYYKLEKWDQAIEKFQPLSSTRDSLGQTSMYLLGDCYLKTGNKKGAKNAFGICSDMAFNASQREAASFLFAKLSYEAGDEIIATRKFNEYINQYPDAPFNPEARRLLSGLLAKTSNYKEAFAIMSDMPVKDNDTWAIYQQVGIGMAMQLMQNNQNSAADSVLNLTLQQPIRPSYEAVTYFWKGEIASREKRYRQAVLFSNTFIERVKGMEREVQSISPAATIQNAYLNIGYAELEDENYESARDAFAKAQQSKSNGTNQKINADALLREADALFMLKNFDKAGALYDKAIAAKTSQSDYAHFQKSIILGLQNKSAEKTALLNQIINQQPPSAYQNEARYELAVSYLETDRDDEAIGILKSISENNSVPELLRSKALFRLAYAYQVNNYNTEAIETYKQYITDYPAAMDRAVAADALRNLYINAGRPEAYDAFLKENDMPAQDEESIENTYYAAAETDYSNSQWTKAIAGFGKYLDRFPKGNRATKAHFYRAEAYRQAGDKAGALKDYDIVVNSGWSDFVNDAATHAAQIALQGKDYQAAQQYYNSLRNSAMDNASLQKAYTGLLTTSFALEEYTAATAYADTLSALPGISNAAKNEALLYKAKSLQKNNRLDEARTLYERIDKENTASASAEARYRIAEILLAQKQLKEAETQASYAAQASGGQEYWVVRSYLLIADILTEQKDYFNAKATLQSIIKNTKEKDIKDEATKKLQNVQQLERNKSKLTEDQ